MANINVTGSNFVDEKITITPTSAYKKTSFTNVLFTFNGQMSDYQGKRIFDHCVFKNCSGLPEWVNFISR